MRGKKRKEIDWCFWKIVIFCSFIFVVYVSVGIMITNHEFKMKECLEPIAIDYCEQGKMYISFSHIKTFGCDINERSIESFEFKFTKEEIEDCKRRIKE